MDEAEYQSMRAELDRPGLGERFISGMGNLVSSIPDALIRTNTDFYNMLTEGTAAEKLPPVEIPRPFPLPAPQGGAEIAADFIPAAIETVAKYGTAAAAGGGALSAMGATPFVAGLGGAAIGGASLGRTDVPETHDVAAQAGIAALQRFGEFLPRTARLPFSLLGGAVAGIQASASGGSPLEALATGAAQVIAPQLFRQQKLETQLSGKVNPNETELQRRLRIAKEASGEDILNPEGEWQGPRTGAPRTPWGPQADAPYFRPPESSASVAAMTDLIGPPEMQGPRNITGTPWGQAAEPPMFRPPGVEPVATLQTPPPSQGPIKIRATPVGNGHFEVDTSNGRMIKFQNPTTVGTFEDAMAVKSAAKEAGHDAIIYQTADGRQRVMALDVVKKLDPENPNLGESNAFRDHRTALLTKEGDVYFSERVPTHADLFNVMLQDNPDVQLAGKGFVNPQGQYVPDVGPTQQAIKERAKPFRTPWGPSPEPPRFKPAKPEPNKPTVVAVPEEFAKPDIHNLRPAININGEVHIGEKYNTHQNILDRHLNMNIEDADALFNFDTPDNPNFFRDVTTGKDYSRKDLKKLFGVKDSQGLSKLQKAAEAEAKVKAAESTPPVPTPEPPPPRGPFRTPWGPTEEPARFKPSEPKTEPIAPKVEPEPVPPKVESVVEEKPTIKKGKNFHLEGTWEVSFSDGRKVSIYRDPENKWWYEANTGKHFSQSVLSTENRADAIKEWVKQNPPKSTEAKAAPVEEAAAPQRKSRAKPLDVERFTEGNDLRIVPEKGKTGTIFETVRDVAPKAGKLRFEVPEGMSHAEANKLFKAKRAEAIATLQTPAAETKPTVPFQDVSSADITDQELRRKGLEVSASGTEVTPPIKGLRKLTGGENAGTYMDVLVKGLAYGMGPIIGAPIGAALDPEDRVRGLVLGAVAGGLTSKYGVKAIEAILHADPALAKKLVTGKTVTGEVAETAAMRGQGETLGRFARWMEKNFSNHPLINRALSKAEGEANFAADSFNIALRELRNKWDGLSDIQKDAVVAAGTADPLTFPAAFATLQSHVTDPEVIAAVLLERHTSIAAQKMILNGMDPKNPMYQTISDRLGTWQRRVYKMHFDPKYIPSEADVEATIQELRLISSSGTGMLGNMMEYDVAKSLVHKYLHDAYVDRGLDGMASKFGHASKGAESLADAMRKRVPELEKRPAFRRMMGEVTEPLEVKAASALKLISAIRSAKYFDEMVVGMTERGNKFALRPDDWTNALHNLRAQISARPPNVEELMLKYQELEHYIPTGDNSNLGKLSNMYVHRQVHDRLPGHDGVFEGNSGPLINAMVSLNNHVKQAKVGANPLSWTRTVLGMPFFLAVSKAKPEHWIEAVFTHMKGNTAFNQEMMKQGIHSGGYGTGEIRKDLGMILHPDINKEGVQRLWNKWVHMGASIFDFADNSVRAAAYISEKERLKKIGGMTEQEMRDRATDWVNRYTPNYSTVARGIRKARQIPGFNQFLTYFSETARITKNLVEDIKTNQNGNRYWAMGVLAGIPAIFATSQYVMEQNLSEKDQKDWEQVKRLLPDYKRQGFLVPTGRNKDGTFRYYNISPLFIADDIAKMTRAIAHGDIKSLMAINPIIGWDNSPAVTVAFAAAGYDLRQGRKIVFNREKADVIRKEILPPLFGGYELDNFVKALTLDRDGNLGTVNPMTGQRFKIQDLLASYVTGVRRTDTRPEILIQRAYYDVQEKQRAIEARLRRVALANPSKSEYEHQVQIAQKQIKELIEDFQRKINGPDFIPQQEK